MTIETAWFLLIGILFIGVGLSTSFIRRIPLTTALIYLTIGVLLGNQALGLIHLNPIRDAKFLEHVTEVVVLISLFAGGLKLRTSLGDGKWRPAIRLAFLSMTLNVALVAFVAHRFLDLSLGAAILLGAILSPTDPVLASDVQVRDPKDQDRLRFGLTGEAGMNDGTAFPFVMLGLGLLGLHDLGEFGWKWFAVDVLWSTVGGVVIGFGLGTLFARFVFRIRKAGEEAAVLDEFLAIGLIGLSYGIALLAHTYGFLSVFFAGLALRQAERIHSEKYPHAERAAERMPTGTTAASVGNESKENPVRGEAPAGLVAPVSTVKAVLGFNEQLERFAETGAVVILGSLLTTRFFEWRDAWFVPALFLVIRPAAVYAGLFRSGVSGTEKRHIAWFGIRGIGSIYYLMFAIGAGLPAALADRLIALTILTTAASILVHGVTVTPIMNAYSKRRERRAHSPRRATKLRPAEAPR